MRWLTIPIGITLLFCLPSGTKSGLGNAGTLASSVHSSTLRGYGQLPLYFIQNQGQSDPRVDYYVQGRDTGIYFTRGGVTLAVAQPGVGRWVSKLEYQGASTDARWVGHDPTPALVNYFTGPASNWKTSVATYASLQCQELWPGIDLTYSGSQNQLKHAFRLRPGADPGRIRIAWKGADLSVTEAGELKAATPAGAFLDEKPYAYQEIGGRRVAVPVEYMLLAPSADGTQAYTFGAGAYDQGRELVIDPAVVVWAGFIGSSGDDEARSIALDDAGNAYIAGSTTASGDDFPAVVGPDLTPNGGTDAFVAKVNPTGTALLWAGFIGGAGEDEVFSIAVDGQGSAYVTGRTTSTEASFPVKTGPDLTYNGGTMDAFVAKLSPDGSQFIYAGYIGGEAEDEGRGIAVDGAGRLYVAGRTASNELSFPVAVGPDLTYNGGTFDGFVACVNTSGSALIYAGYIGGSEQDSAVGLALDSAGNVYVGGGTASTETSFPVKTGPDLTYNGGTADMYVAKVNASGTGLVYAGYVDGSGSGWINDLAVDSAGSLYVIGATSSDQASFPVRIGPVLTHGGDLDCFLAKVNPSGTALDFAGYLGGAARDVGTSVALDGKGDIYVSINTWSDQTTFPVKDGPVLMHSGGGPDALVAKVSANGSTILYAGYIGGTGADYAWEIAVDRYGHAYVVGGSDEGVHTFSTPDRRSHSGGRDAFLVKVATGPVITEVLNAAGLVPAGLPGSGIAQGALFVVKGHNLGPEVLEGPVAPVLPSVMQGSSISVTVQGVTKSAFLVYTWKNQLAAVLPSTTPLGWGTITVTYGGETSPPAPIEVVANAVGIFTRTTAGYGPAIIQNWISATEAPRLNSYTDSARPKQIEILWATGLGAIAGDDAGMPPVGDLNVDTEVLVGGKSARVAYKGRSYSYPGVDQIQFEVPEGVEGCHVPVAVRANGVIGNHATMAISQNGGVCTSTTGYSAQDLQKAALGQPTKLGAVHLARVDITAPLQPGGFRTEFVGARFAGRDANSLHSSLGPVGWNLGLPPASLGSCIVHKGLGEGPNIEDISPTTGLDAGSALNLTGPRGAKQIEREAGMGGAYGLEMEGENYVEPGIYSISNGGGGTGVGPFQASITMPNSLFGWTNRDSITRVNRAQDLTVTWTGGDSNSELVAILGYSADTSTGVVSTFMCAASPGARSFTVPAYILRELPVSSPWDGQDYPPSGVIVTVLSRLDLNRFTAPNLDGAVFYYLTGQQHTVPFD